MNTLDKIVGTFGTFLIDGATATAMPEGYAAYAMIVATDSTEVTEMDHLVLGAAVTVDNLSWQGVALSRGDYIAFEKPVVSVTLTNSGDRVLLYLQPTDYIAPVEA